MSRLSRRPSWRPAERMSGVFARRIGALALALSTSVALAHPMLVIGEVRFAPDPPVPGRSATVVLSLQDTSLTEVEDAVVFLELRAGTPAGENDQPRGEPLVSTDRLEETAPGVYETSVEVPEYGDYTLSIRDRTYRQEEAVANVELVLDGDPVDFVPFVLPPTATGPASLGSWLIWLVGVPLLAGVVVTVLVLRSGRGADDAGEASSGPDSTEPSRRPGS